jgi:L-threonylcarbamoyladenylate synthase
VGAAHLPDVPTITRTLSVDPNMPDPASLEEAARVLRGGGLVAFATETVYGLGAVATDPEAVARIFEAKGRPAFNPLIVHAHEVALARSCVAEWPPDAETLANRFWPGPLTLVLPRSPIIPDLVTAGRETVGVRIPSPPVARLLIATTGLPIAAPSANRSTGISPTLARHVLKDLDGKIDLILDSGLTGIGLESTVLDLSANPPRILRPGAITAEQLAEALGVAVAGKAVPTPRDDPEGFRSPGQMAIHYAPRTPAVLVDPDQLPLFVWSEKERFGLLVFGRPELPTIPEPALRRDLPTPAEAASALYATLHDWDERNLDWIVVVPPPESPEWRAIRDRLRRATRPFGPLAS